MKHRLPWLLSLLLIACTSSRQDIRFVPPEEAAWFKFPARLPDGGQQRLPGPIATAIQLAMDDFLPRETRAPRGASPQDVCLILRQSYDVEAAPGPGGVVWVAISLSPGACTLGGGPPLDMSATYAVDTQLWRILAVREP